MNLKVGDKILFKINKPYTLIEKILIFFKIKKCNHFRMPIIYMKEYIIQIANYECEMYRVKGIVFNFTKEFLEDYAIKI